MTRLRAGYSRVRVLAWARYFCCPDCTHRPWGPLSLVFNGDQSSFSGVKRPARDTDHVSPSTVKVRNEDNYISNSLLCYCSAEKARLDLEAVNERGEGENKPLKNKNL